MAAIAEVWVVGNTAGLAAVVRQLDPKPNAGVQPQPNPRLSKPALRGHYPDPLASISRRAATTGTHRSQPRSA